MTPRPVQSVSRIPAAGHATTRPRRSRATLLERRVAAFAKVLPHLRRGDVAGIHRTRVAGRRLREALPVVAGSVAGARKIRRTLREVGRALGEVREIDVSLALIEELAATGRFERASLDRLAAVLARDRGRAWADARRTLADADADALVDRLRTVVRALRKNRGKGRIAGSAAAAEWLALLELRVSRRADEVVAAIDAAGSLYLPERLHRARIAVKKLRYARELVEEARGRRTPSARLRVLKDVQGTLGRLHHLQVLTDRTRVLQASMPQPRLTTWSELHILQRALENECRELHAVYMGRRDALRSLAGTLRTSAAAGQMPGDPETESAATS